jgi:hypothetical protein
MQLNDSHCITATLLLLRAAQHDGLDLLNFLLNCKLQSMIAARPTHIGLDRISAFPASCLTY